MLFQSLSFMLFCLAVFVLYWTVPKARLWVLAFANALFYAAAGWQNLGLFLGASILTYVLGQHVTGERGRWAMGAGIALNVANLFFFKYSAFAASSLAGWLPGLDLKLFTSVLLPIGISFYTFQHISYLVDRRIKGLEAAPSYLQFWVYISFFGHSIAGPIMRGHEFFPQIAETTRKTLDRHELKLGLALFLFGLSKKMIIADRLAPLVDHAFGHPDTLSMAQSWVAAMMFAFQIYYDFSAYSDMAVGIGLFFGYRLVQNFRTPYLSANASEFWQRWHVTLSSWIRDYVYIPLGGSRTTPSRAQLNVFLAMLVSGLWHGAAWTFVFWGAFHGFLLLGQRALGGLKRRLGWDFFAGSTYHWLAVGAFFGLTTMGWVLFRAPNMETAFLILGRMVQVSDWSSVLNAKLGLVMCAGLFALHALEHQARNNDGAWVRQWAEKVPAPIQSVAYTLVFVTLLTSFTHGKEFIYFQF